MNPHQRPWDLEDDGEDVEIVDDVPIGTGLFKGDIHKNGVDALPMPKPNSISHHSFLHDLPAPAWSENMEDVATPWNEALRQAQPDKGLEPEPSNPDYLGIRFREAPSATVSEEAARKRKQPQGRRKAKKVATAPRQTRPAQNSLYLPSHKSPWTEEERQLFEEGLASFGRGSWKLISEHVGTRNARQVKNFARQHFKKLEISGKSSLRKVNPESGPISPGKVVVKPERLALASPEVILRNPEIEDTSEEIEIDDDLPPPPVDQRPIIPDQIPALPPRNYEPSSNANSQSERSESQSLLDVGGRVFTEARRMAKDLPPTDLHLPSSTSLAPDKRVASESHSRVRFDDHVVEVLFKPGEGDSEASLHSDISPSRSPSESPESLPAMPIQERLLPTDSVDEDEKKWNPEFFSGKTVKTEERYLTIRNFIIDCWRQRQPAYLSKTSVRTGLKDCGDVNAIGRIHSFLEQVGAINFGAERPARYRKTAHRESKRRIGVVSVEELSVSGPRRRKVRNERGDWITEDEKERASNVTIVHEPDAHGASGREREKKPKDLDQYTLVPCRQFAEHASPFTVTLLTQVLIISDLHAQMDTLEIIGLLGGHYDPFRRVLQIEVAVPCAASHASPFSCELDPASAAAARDLLVEDLKLDVVGWYHSHPSFAPQPSIVDIQNQGHYQALFAKGNVEPFVGLVINPEHAFNTSYTLFTTVTESDPTARLPRVPFEVPHEVLPISQISDFFLKQIVHISRSGVITEERLNKVFHVVTSYMYLPQELLHSLTDKLKQLLTGSDPLLQAHQLQLPMSYISDAL